MQLFIVKDYVRLQSTGTSYRLRARIQFATYSQPLHRESIYLLYFWTIDAFPLATLELRLIRDSRAFASLCKEVVTRVERYIYVHNVRSHLA